MSADPPGALPCWHAQVAILRDNSREGPFLAADLLLGAPCRVSDCGVSRPIWGRRVAIPFILALAGTHRNLE